MLSVDLIFFAVLLLFTGSLAGFLAGLFGVGGGAVMVPVMYEFFSAIDVPEEVRIHLAIGTSLAIIIPTSIRSYRGRVVFLGMGCPVKGPPRSSAIGLR